MNKSKLKDIANVLRRDSLIMTTAAGSGHPSSCLSCADIMSVLFFNEMKYDIKNSFNPDNDEFIMSKGHAAPILYSALFRSGCIKEKLENLRKIDSNLEGHPVPKSLKWIKVATGSLGQGLGVGVGMALAAKKQKRNFKIFVLMGDSESAEGSVCEALELGAYYKLNNLIGIIDVNRLGQRGETLLGHKTEDYKKRIEGFGWKAIVIDGHSIKQILKAFESAKKSNKPTMIIAKTLKGKGVELMENKDGWHGKTLDEEQLKVALEEVPNVLMPNIKVKLPKKISYKSKKEKIKLIKYMIGEKEATRKVYGKTLANLAKANSDIIAVDAEVSNSTYSEEVKKVNPEQFVESFIAEQNMVGMGLGLSVKGFNVFVSTFAAFLSRAHDQIRMAAVSSANISFSGSHVGVSIGEDGGSQMGLEDIGMFRALPESIVFYPSDAVSTQKLTIEASKLKGIKYIRTSRPKTLIIYNNDEEFLIGDFKVLRKSGNDKGVLVGSGVTVQEALKAYEVLRKKGIKVAVVDLYCIKPFNHQKFIKFVKAHGSNIILAEDHRPEGGIGEMVSGGLMGTGIKMKHLAVREIPHSGKGDELMDKYGINWRAYVREFKRIK